MICVCFAPDLHGTDLRVLDRKAAPSESKHGVALLQYRDLITDQFGVFIDTACQGIHLL